MSIWAEPNEELILAAKAGDVKAVEAAIANGADINFKDERSMTPIYHAAANGHAELLRFLIGKSANIDEPDKFGMPPLQAAIDRKKKPAALLLIEAGANLNIADRDGYTALHRAILEIPDLSIILIEKGADIEAQDSITGSSPIFYAVEKNHFEIVKLLIAKGAIRDVRNREGKTPKMMVKNKKMFKLLVDGR